MLGGSQNNNDLFSHSLKLAKSQEADIRMQGKIKIFELLNASQVSQIKKEDIIAAIVLSNNMGNEKINNQTSLNMLELIFNIPSVKDKMNENAYDLLAYTIELADIETLEILKNYSEIKSTLSECKEDFLEIAENYNYEQSHDHVIEWISQQNRNRNRP